MCYRREKDVSLLSDLFNIIKFCRSCSSQLSEHLEHVRTASHKPPCNLVHSILLSIEDIAVRSLNSGMIEQARDHVVHSSVLDLKKM